MPPPRTWEGMWAHQSRRLEEQTGQDVAAWSARVEAEAPDDEMGVRRWLTQQGVTGYPQMLLVMERFGYPHFLQAPEDELIDAQYADRPALRPILDSLLALLRRDHPEAEIVARKTYVSLYTPRRQFGAIKATTRRRIDLGLRLDGHTPQGRLLEAKRLANESINLRLALERVEDVDEEVASWLEQAWVANAER